MTQPTSPAPAESSPSASASSRHWLVQLFIWTIGLMVAGTLSVAMIVAMSLAVAFPNLPDISDLSDYRPKLPLRVFSADGELLGEFGEERRHLTPIQDIPKVMVDAILAIEDSRFYQHSGVDYLGIIRAGLANVNRVKSQGASTITMQVARNVYLSSEKTFTRKLYEILLTFKMEHMLTKDQILEIYMNQIFLGHRAYGFAAASETYFGKPLKEITIAEAAMLAGLPKAPSLYNPISNPKRARARQLHIINRMVENNFISAQEAAEAKKQVLVYKNSLRNTPVHAEFITEMVRQLMFNQYGDETYSRGLNVYTTIQAKDQEAAYKALRRGIMDFEKRQFYRGPEKFVTLPTSPEELEEAIDDALESHPDNGDLLAALVLEANPKMVKVVRRNGEILDISGEGLKPVLSGLSDKAQPHIKIRRGAIVRIAQSAKGGWDITQLPEVEGAFVALDPRDGSIKALVGGFDFGKNKFNNVTQAWRQPGSSFKPFIYSASFEKGFTPATIINDAPLFFGADTTGSKPWEPKNYDGKFDGPMSMRTAMAKSKNMVSIRILQSVGAPFAQEWVTRFGFDADKHPPYLTMALGAGSVTPMQMAIGYSVFANGGYRVNPWLISKVTEQRGKVLIEAKPPVLTDTDRVIDSRNAFMTSQLLQEVTRAGTAARAQATLKRRDLYGKTGTTNDSMDTWFAGYQPTLTAVAWVGYSIPRKLGERETGGGLSLPIWISFMETALAGVPVAEIPAPEGVVYQSGEWYYDEFALGAGVTEVGTSDALEPESSENPLPPDEKQKIMDLFKN